MIKITLRSIGKNTISFDVNPTTTFAEIEEMLIEQSNENNNFKGSNYKFIYNGKCINPTDTVESINYTPSSFITVSFHRPSTNRSMPPQPDSNDQDYNEEVMEKAQVIAALGYDLGEVLEAFKKFDFDVEKAKNYICDRIDNESNKKLVEFYQSNHSEAKRVFSSYLEETDPELAKKVAEMPYPMLVMMGIDIQYPRRRHLEDYYDTYPYFY